jgi:flagellin-like hook-associated protein FlgL
VNNIDMHALDRVSLYALRIVSLLFAKMITVNPLSNISALTAPQTQHLSLDILSRINRLSSGSAVAAVADNPAQAGVSLQISSRANSAHGRLSNLSNSLSFLQTQQDALLGMSGLLDRVSELKEMLSDPTRSVADKVSYEKEFVQLKNYYDQLAAESFNGVSLFASGSTSVNLTLSASNAAQSVSVSQPSLKATDLANVFGNATSRYIAGTTTQNPNTYSYVNFSGVWSDAEADAESKGGYLAVVTSQSELSRMASSLGTDYNKEGWLGAQLVDNEWQWVSGETMDFSNWSSDYPLVALQLPGIDVSGNTLAKLPASDSANPNKWTNLANTDLGFLTLTTPEDGYFMEKNGTTTTTAGYFETAAAPTLSEVDASVISSAVASLAQLEASNASSQSQIHSLIDSGRESSISLQRVLSVSQDANIPSELTALLRSQALYQSRTLLLKQSYTPEQVMLKLIG